MVVQWLLCKNGGVDDSGDGSGLSRGVRWLLELKDMLRSGGIVGSDGGCEYYKDVSSPRVHVAE